VGRRGSGGSSGSRWTGWTTCRAGRRLGGAHGDAIDGGHLLPVYAKDLDRITVPTTLIRGRHDLGVRLNVVDPASAGYRWPRHVIENARDDPAIEQPQAFLRALHAALGKEAA